LDKQGETHRDTFSKHASEQKNDHSRRREAIGCFVGYNVTRRRRRADCDGSFSNRERKESAPMSDRDACDFDANHPTRDEVSKLMNGDQAIAESQPD
jgi:hypothetical protein